jgi:cytochrome c553
MTNFLRRLLFASLLSAAAVSLPAGAADLTSSSPLVAGCEACHGAGGNSRRAGVPRLNGQQSEYIVERLKEIFGPAHAGNKAISNVDAAALAQYFSSQMPPQRIGAGIFAEKGREIFLNGAQPAIPGCATCHGPDGRGLGITPGIAGQHADYLTRQLNSFMSSKRISVPMNRHTWDMTMDQASELSAYLANQ